MPISTLLSTLNSDQNWARVVSKKKSLEQMLLLLRPKYINNEKKKRKIWKQPPMQAVIANNNLFCLCFLNILGGQWSSINHEQKSCLALLLDCEKILQSNISIKIKY